MSSLALTPRGHLLFSGPDDAPQLPAALSPTLQCPFAPGVGTRRPRQLHPSEAPQRRAGAVRVCGVLPAPSVAARQGTAPAARPRTERIRGRREQVTAALAASAGPARGRRVSVAEDDGRRG